MKKAMMAISVSTILSACSTPLDYETGTHVSQQQLAGFQKGTTQEAVLTQIGHPNRKEGVNGTEIWYYDYNKVGAMFDNVSESTVLEWNSDGTLLGSYKTGKAGGKSGNPLIDAANSQ